MLWVLLALASAAALESPAAGFSNYRFGLVLTKLQEAAAGTLDKAELAPTLEEGREIVDQLRFGPEADLRSRAEQAEELEQAVARAQPSLTAHKLTTAHSKATLQKMISSRTAHNLELEHMNAQLEDALRGQKRTFFDKAAARQQLRTMIRRVRQTRRSAQKERALLVQAFKGENPTVDAQPQGVGQDFGEASSKSEHQLQQKATLKPSKVAPVACHGVRCVLAAKLASADAAGTELIAKNTLLIQSLKRATGKAKDKIERTLDELSQVDKKQTAESRLVGDALKEQVRQNREYGTMLQRMRQAGDAQGMLDSAPPL